jgi:hypothetical protein
MFCEKLWMSSSSANLGLIFVILLEGKSCIKQAYDNFCTVIVCCVEHRKNSKYVV